jgi:hypothetical protein
MIRVPHLTPAQVATLVALWRAHPTATRTRIAELATAALGRPVSETAARDHRPAPPRPRARTRTLPYVSPLDALILEAQAVRRRLGIARKGVAR